MRNAQLEKMRKWDKVEIHSNYDRRDERWSLQKVTPKDLSSDKLWFFCPTCVEKGGVTTSPSEYRDFVEAHLRDHPKSKTFFVSESLYKFQTFDSFLVKFIPSQVVPDWFERKIPLDEKRAFEAFREEFESHYYPRLDENGCKLYVNQNMASLDTGRDNFRFYPQEGVRHSKKVKPSAFAWSLAHGSVPNDSRLNKCSWNQFCIEVSHMTLEPVDVPQLETL
jgi:hypothetical protein